jgi:predicted kinase
MQIVIVGGLPCSGKSKLAERLRARWLCPLLCKDIFKELLFDTLGGADRAWSRRVSAAAYEIMFRHAEELLLCGISSIVEGNFRDHEHRARFARLSSLGATFVQIHCVASSEVLVARFRERARSGRRHAGHADIESLPEMENELLTALQEPMPVDGPVVECDTTVDWQRAVEIAVDRAMAFLG